MLIERLTNKRSSKAWWLYLIDAFDHAVNLEALKIID